MCSRASTEESSQKRRLKVADTVRAYMARSTREINDTLPIHDPVPIFDLWAPNGPRTRFSTHITPMPAWVGGVSWLCDSYACTCHGFAGRVRTHTHTHTRTDAKRFYYLSHVICYSYGADNKNENRVARKERYRQWSVETAVWPPFCEARKCEPFAALTVRSPIWC